MVVLTNKLALTAALLAAAVAPALGAPLPRGPLPIGSTYDDKAGGHPRSLESVGASTANARFQPRTFINLDAVNGKLVTRSRKPASTSPRALDSAREPKQRRSLQARSFNDVDLDRRLERLVARSQKLPALTLTIPDVSDDGDRLGAPVGDKTRVSPVLTDAEREEEMQKYEQYLKGMVEAQKKQKKA